MGFGSWWYRRRPRYPNRVFCREALSLELLESRRLLASLRIASWNTLNQPDNATQDGAFQTVLAAIAGESVQGMAKRLDVLALVETDPTSAARVRDVINSVHATTSYQVLTTSLDGGGDATGFVYDTSSVSLMESLEITANVTHNILRGKFRPVATGGEADFYMYSIHLKSGTTASDVTRRTNEMTLLRGNADALGEGTQVIFAGDLNLQGSSEGAWAAVTAAGAAQATDPLNAPGTWSNNASFVGIHTQNTSFLLRRLDFHFLTAEFDDGIGLEYVPGSFHAFGNNGTHGLGNPITSGSGASANVLSALVAASDHLPVISDYEIIPSFPLALNQTGDSTQVTEGGKIDSYTAFLRVPPTAPVSLTLAPDSQLDLGEGAGVSRVLTFTAANYAVPQTVVVRAVNDAAAEGTHLGTINHQATSADPRYSGLAIDPISVTIVDNDNPSLVINEVDSDTLGIDNLEFVELYDGGFGNRSLTGTSLVFYGGATDQVYAVFDLDGRQTDPQGYFVLGNAAVANVDLVIPDDTLRNGADAVAIFAGDGTSFPVGAPISIGGLLDALVYDTDDADDPGLLPLLLAGQPQINENQNLNRSFESMARIPNSGVPRTTSSYRTRTPTPGASNVIEPNLAEIVINEVDSDTSGTDILEFIELYDGGVGNASLDGLSVVLFNGAGDTQYAAYDLDGRMTDANGFFVIGNAGVQGVDLVIPNNTIQNGADAIALYRGNPSEFPLPTVTNLVDALVYDTNDADDPELLALLLAGQSQVNEAATGDSPTFAMARIPDGGAPRETATYSIQLPTPGTHNAAPAPDADFNDDGLLDCVDVNALVAAIVALNHAPNFDLNQDGLVNGTDLGQWLALAGAHNLPSQNPYRLGDTNLDGVVDGSDFNLWNANKFTAQAAWCAGDFNADGSVDGSDFNLWNANKFTSSDVERSYRASRLHESPQFPRTGSAGAKMVDLEELRSSRRRFASSVDKILAVLA